MTKEEYIKINHFRKSLYKLYSSSSRLNEELSKILYNISEVYMDECSTVYTQKYYEKEIRLTCRPNKRYKIISFDFQRTELFVILENIDDNRRGIFYCKVLFR